jgi:uncharacterized protein
MAVVALRTAAPTSVPTLSGRFVDLADPQPESILLDDLAIGLSRVPRWVGQTRHAFSVAQHAMLVHALLLDTASPVMRLAALAYRGVDAYLCAPPDALKSLLPDYPLIEERLLRAIYTALGIPAEFELRPSALEQADALATRLEATHLHRALGEAGGPSSPRIAALLVPMSPSTAHAYYLTQLRNALERMTS